MPPGLRNRVRELRHAAGLQQLELAARVGISRQSLGAVEKGDSAPSTPLALQLARVLGCRVEELFQLDERGGSIVARAAAPLAAGQRVLLGWVRDAWVAHALAADSGTPADGLVVRVRGASVTALPLRDEAALRANILCAGCDPAVGLLAGHVADAAGRPRLHHLSLASGPALDALVAGRVHVAGVHLHDEGNLPAVQRRLQGQAFTLINLATWAQGIVARRAKGARSLRGLRVASREEGSGARALLDRLRGEGAAFKLGPELPGHFAVARAVADGRVDAGIATAAAAHAFGLAFTPLIDDQFDLVVPGDLAEQARLGETLASARFRRDLGALPGYGARRTGTILARSPS